MALVVVAIVVFVWHPWIKPQGKSTVVSVGEVTEELVISGDVRAVEYAFLSFATNGELKSVSVKEGEGVKKGRLMASLDTGSLQTAVITANNAWLSADATAKRAEDDVKDHASDETYEQKETRVNAQTARDAAYFKWQQAVRDLMNAYLRAPFDGIVTQIAHPYAGVFVTATQPQIEVLNPETIFFSVTADQTEVKKIKEGQPVKIVLDSYTDENHDGVVSSIGMTPETGQTGIVYEVKINFNKLDLDKFRIGMSGDASLVTAQKQNVLYVSPEFIFSDLKGKYVKLGTKDSDKRYITVGIEGTDKTEIIGDIKEGQLIYD